MRLSKAMVNIEKRTKVTFDHSSVEDYVTSRFRMNGTYRSLGGVSLGHVQSWRQQSHNHMIFCEVDKCKEEVAVVCPKLWQKSLFNAQVLTQDLDFHIPVNISSRFEKAAVDYHYSGAIVDSRRHKFGQLDWFPKFSGFSRSEDSGKMEFVKDTKWRPVGSYSAHFFRTLFSTVCRAVMFMLSVVNPQNISVNSSGKVIDGFASLNRKIKTRSDAGWIPLAFPYKVDVDQFFSRIGHDKILDALVKMIALWRGLY